MEQMRLLLAIVLTFVVFLAWELLFSPQKPVAPPPEAPDKPVTEQAVDKSPEEQPLESSKASPHVDIPVPDTSFGTITVETDLYSAEISEKGAALSRFVLKNYKEGPGQDDPLKALVGDGNQSGTAIVRLNGTPEGVSSRAVFTTDLTQKYVRINDAPEVFSFFWRSGDGLILEKRYTFHPRSYEIGMSIIVANQSDQTVDAGILVDMRNPPPEGRSFVFRGPFAYIDSQLKEIDIDDIDKKNLYQGNIYWTGIEDRYFMTALIAESPVQTQIKLFLDETANQLQVTYVQPSDPLPPASRHRYDYQLFLGPKRMPVLNQVGYDLKEAINFGFFDIIAKPCLWLMNAIHDRFIPNYGVAIILLTILFKLIFWPLGNKSYRSMAEMKKLQPLMTEIRKKYKDDKQKMNEEVMRLYRTYKVNPLSGCLPMLVQIPVFIAFYRMLYEAIELRHAPFLLWINDLSAPDRLFNFGFSIPFMTPPFGIPVLTIIMGATMFLQQKLSPPPGDPTQAKFMMMMPLIFTVIFINFPSGLVLYWLTNNLLSIAQQYYITRKTA